MRMRYVKRPLGVLGDLPDCEPGQRACFFGGGGGSTPAGSTTTTQTSQPFPGELPYLTGGGSTAVTPGTPGTNPNNTTPASGIFPAAANLYQNYTPQYFPFSTVAPLNPTQEAGLGLETAMGLGGTPAVNSAGNFLSNEENGAFLPGGAAFDPYIGSQISTTLASTVPQIESQFAQGNRMNSGEAGFSTGQGVGTAIGNLYGTLYQNGLSAMNQGSFSAPGIENANLTNAQAVLGAGATEQQQGQAQINDLINRFNFQQMLPYQQLSQFASTIGGAPGGSQITTAQPFFEPSTASQVLGGVGTAGSLGLLAAALFGGGSSG